MASNERHQSVRESFERTLVEDVGIALDRRSASDTQGNRREFVRTTFAAIEGIIWSYRETVTSAAADLGVLLPDEEAALAESVVQVGQNGSISKQPRFIPLLHAFRLATRIAQHIDSSIEVDFSGTGWRQMRRAIEVRNRVTHPKSQTDLIIDELDLQTCTAAFYWLLEVNLTVLSATNSALAVFVDDMWEILAGLKAGDPSILAEYEAARRALQDDD